METLFGGVQHIQIRLEHISKHFYKKMLSQITFGGFPTSLMNVSQFCYVTPKQPFWCLYGNWSICADLFDIFNLNVL